MVILKKAKKSFLLCCITVLLLAFALGVGFFAREDSATLKASADVENKTATSIEKVESFEDRALIFYLSESDYMTSSWTTEDYKWVNELAEADKANYNVCNALLDKNLDSYNYGDMIFLDGVALKEYDFNLVANKFQRPDGLGFEFSSTILSGVERISIKEGCQLPTLAHSYFGNATVSCLEIQEDVDFVIRNGVWAKQYPFDGYQSGVLYDACERFFYLRADNSNFKGHTEAPTREFTDIFSREFGRDEGYALASTSDTDIGNLVVADLVWGIDTQSFGTIKLNLYSNISRNFVSYNASTATEESLGEVLEVFTIPSGFSSITLNSALYADGDGMVDTIVFQFTNDGQGQQFFITSFSCAESAIQAQVYNDSFFIRDFENHYLLTFRFNEKGAFAGTETVDTSKVIINGESVDKINANGAYAEAEWIAIQGIYQINVKLFKVYTGAGAIKNPDKNYACNSMCVEKGLLFPNGNSVDRSYTCHIYEEERFVDYEQISEYEDIKVVGIEANIIERENNNLQFSLKFDKRIVAKMYLHANQTEAWRSTSLAVYADAYDAQISEAFVIGGFKSALCDNIFINGNSLGDWEALDSYVTYIFVQCGQKDSYTMDINVDSRADMYPELLNAFKNGEDITIEIKNGLKFTTNCKIAQNQTFVVNGSSVTELRQSEDLVVYYSGVAVADGDKIQSEIKANQDSICVSGAKSYEISKAVNGNVTTFTVVADGETISFQVEENIVNEIVDEPAGSEEGCSSNVSYASLTFVAAAVALCLILTKRGKEHE